MFKSMRHIFLFLFFSLSLTYVQAQDNTENVSGFHFGPKLGLSLGTQNWDGFERRPMANYHFAMFVESLDPDLKGSLYAQLGYHARGSGLRLQIGNLGGVFTNQAFIYRNISLALGVKKRIVTSSLSTPYYFVGIRGEYNVNNNLKEVRDEFSIGASNLFYPFEVFVRDITYGISFGGGFEFYGGDFVQPAIEFNFSPDLSFQYMSEEVGSVINPFNGQPVNLPARNIRNVTFEVSLVLRFLRQVVYID